MDGQYCIANKNFMEKHLIEIMYATALNCDMPIISTDTSARILAVVYVHGNNEFMVHSPKFNVERNYIQKRFGIEGGASPNPMIIPLIKKYTKELEDFEKANPEKRYPKWAIDLFKERYGFNLIN